MQKNNKCLKSEMLNTGNGLKCLKMALNGLKWLEMAGIGHGVIFQALFSLVIASSFFF